MLREGPGYLLLFCGGSCRDRLGSWHSAFTRVLLIKLITNTALCFLFHRAWARKKMTQETSPPVTLEANPHPEVTELWPGKCEEGSRKYHAGSVLVPPGQSEIQF